MIVIGGNLMFGSKKKKNVEDGKAIFAKMSEKREDFDTTYAQVEECEKRMLADTKQVLENTSNLILHAENNIEEEASLIHTLDEFSKEWEEAGTDYNQLVCLVEEQFEASKALVEENKHYTTPAKYLTATPDNLRQTNLSQQKKLDEMAENGKKIGVLALNAATLAGKIDGDGKELVSTAEEIRQVAVEYEQSARLMKEELVSAVEKIDELEEIVYHLVSLMKENNKGTTRLLKKCQESVKQVKDSAMRDFGEDIVGIRDKVIGLKNLDEEIAKCGERNKIQLGDIEEELQKQKTELRELESDMSYMLDLAQEQIK